jgi:hypothetical protein
VSRPTDEVNKPGEPTPEDIQLIETIAKAIVVRRMTAPAILFLESSRPLSFLGSQFLYFLEPIVRAFIRGDQYRRVAQLLEDRENVERLMLAIEAAEGDAQERERELKRQKAKEKRP